MICVYAADATDFSNNGLCVLTPTSCTVSETLNGEWELTMVHPMDDLDKWSYLQVGNIIRAPVPASMTPRIQMPGISGSPGTLIYKIDTSQGTTPYGTLRLRSQPSSSASVLSNYKNSSEVIVLSTADPTWYEVTTLDGKRGYMMAQYLQYVRTEGRTEDVAGQFIESKQVRDQPFRIYRMTPTLTEIKVYARHLFYDLLGNMIYSYKPSGAVSGAVAASAIFSSCQSAHPFTVYSDITATAEGIEVENINPVEDILTNENGIVKKYSAELVRDWYDVYLVQRVGRDTDTEIRYGKNLLGGSCDYDETGLVTRIVPTGEDADGNILYLPERYIDSPYISAYPQTYWAHLPVSDAKESESMSRDAVYTKLRQAAQDEYAKGCDLPKLSVDVDFLNLDDTEEYRDFGILHSIFLGDSVRVIVPKFSLTIALRMTQYTYDCLTKKYTKCILGNATETPESSLITPDQLSAGSIGNAKLALASVGTGQLRSGAVGSLQVKTAAIGSAHIQQAAIGETHIQEAAINYAAIKQATIDQLKADAISATSAYLEYLIAHGITTDTLYSSIAEISDARIGVADISFAQIVDAVADNLITKDAIADNYYIRKLRVDNLQTISLGVNNLVVKAADGYYYALTVDDNGAVTAERTDVSATEISAGVTADGQRSIIETDLLVSELSATNIKGANALLDKLTARRISVDALFAREAFVGKLETTDISGNGYLRAMVDDKLDDMTVGGRNYLRNSGDLDFSGYYIQYLSGDPATGVAIASVTRLPILDYGPTEPYIGYGEIDFAILEE